MYSGYSGPYGRVFPPAVPDTFMASARRVRPAISEAEILTNKIAGSRDLSKRIMEAAQASKTETVRNLIASTGVRKNAGIIYDPDGITIVFTDVGCCSVSVTLRWK
ncbi:hypothetical protein [Neobacillus piezotolerans]|nr:hypothetical protein [Neobacillus piezotolerans]